ncbi:MAG: hypothetical protein RMM53_09195, partial [Bacteroidia bacterium]|nr:hypothetical protein [Bacteroidia bacterium]
MEDRMTRLADTVHRFLLSDGRVVRISPAEKHWPHCVRIEIGEPPVFIEALWRFEELRARKTLFSAAHIEDEDAERIVRETAQFVARITEQHQQNATVPTLAVVVRELTQPRSSGELHCVESVEAMLALLRREYPPNMVAEWDDETMAAVLDIDFHQELRPSLLDLHALGDRLAPAPRCWWVSSGGGLKAVYWPLDGQPYTAYELAVAAAAYAAGDATVVSYRGTVEVLTRTRLPNSVHRYGAEERRCGPVQLCVPNTSFTILARLSRSQASETEIQEVLERQQWKIGQRLPHTACLIDPQHVSKSSSPVIILETGVYCHSCAGRLGDGFRSWGAVRRIFGLSASEELDVQPILDAARNFTHFHHVWYLFDALYGEIPERYRQVLY